MSSRNSAHNAEYLLVLLSLSRTPRTRRFSSSERIPRRARWRRSGIGMPPCSPNWSGKAVAALDLAGAGVPAGAGLGGLRWRGRAAVVSFRAARPSG